MTTYYEIEPYETTDIPEAGVTVYHDGDEESAVRVDDDKTLRLGATNGEWQVRLLGEQPEDAA